MDFLKNKDASFAAAKALFEAANKPEVRNAAVAASKNPIVRDVAKSAAKDPQTRQLVMESLMKQQQAQAHTDKPAPPPKVKSPVRETPPVPRHNNTSNYSSTVSNYGHNSATTSNSSSRTTNYTSNGSTSNYTPQSIYPSLSKDLGSMSINTSKPQSYGYASNSNSTGFSPSRPVPPLPNSSQKSPTQEPYAVTLYPFQGSQFDELTCETGDKIVLKREVDDQWIYGMNMRTGQHGIVPLGYLEVRIPLAPTTSSAPSAHALPPNTTCALYDYLTGVDGDLQFRSGDRITVLEYVNADWLKGESAGKTGIFPANYVDTTSLTLAPPKQPVQSAAQETGETITVAFDYNSGVADDLVCRAGDVISVIERVNSDWIKGRLNGKEGLVPTTYLQKSSSIASIGKALKEMSLEMTAIADYSPSEPGHMEISRGDKVTVLEDVDEYWYKARLSDRAFRFIPPAFVPKNILQ